MFFFSLPHFLLLLEFSPLYSLNFSAFDEYYLDEKNTEK